jgi:hypothetical protein
MDKAEHEYYVNWIIADSTPFRHNDKYYYIKSPSREARLYAQEIFFEYYYKSIKEGVTNREEVYNILAKLKIWDQTKEKLLNIMKKEMEDLKVKIFQNYTNSPTRRGYKIALKDTKNYVNKLVEEKFSFEQNTAEGLAGYAKHQFLIGSSIYTSKSRPYWKSFKCWELPDNILNIANRRLMKFSISDSDYRELARSDIWKGIWSARKNGGLFGKNTVDLSDSQKSLIFWSILYDNIYQASDCPPDEIVEDDDALDGWMILKKRERADQLNKDIINDLMSDKVKNSEHIFIVCGEEDIEKVYNMNDIGGKIALSQRLNKIKQGEIVPEAAMPDTIQKIQMEINKQGFGR